MNLVVDIGNTFTKLAVFDRQLIQDFIRTESNDTGRILQFAGDFQSIKAGIISSVNREASGLNKILSEQFPCILLDHHTPLPFLNGYTSPESLGKDRLAGIAAASAMFPHEEVLVMDAGTAITLDLLTADSTYRGGSISPGISMRYRALNTFTGRLPLLEAMDEASLTGNTTAGSIHSGVLNGVVTEVEGFINRYLARYPSLKIILTGGDYKYFDKQLKVKTFAAPNLVLEGLNIILNYNLEK